jgi:hypothetical protein
VCCGRPGSEFTWFQRVRTGVVDGARPERERYLCDLVCLGRYASEHLDGVPETLPVGVY